VRILITGSAGFLAQHVMTAVSRTQPDVELVGLQRSSRPKSSANGIVQCDLSSASETSRALEGCEFDVCVHAAGATAAGPRALYRDNVAATANLFDVLGSRRAVRRVVLISSSAVYGRGGDGDVDEATPVAPVSAYGESSVAREMTARLFARGHSLELVTLRLFNLVGPGQQETMLIPAIARQIARIEAGLQAPELTVGRLDTSRDYVDVRDAAAAVTSVALAAGPLPAVLNLGLGDCWSGSDVVRMLVQMANGPIRVVTKQDPARSSDVLRIRNTSTLARRIVSWNPSFSFEQSLRDTLSEWRLRSNVHTPSTFRPGSE
jgi:nucleoside-diphosphate-sugar epimerase